MTLVMVHGSGSGRESWHYQLEAFPGSHAVNLPGHPCGEFLPHVEDCARWLREYVTGRGISDPVIAGHSLGGAVALQYGLDYPDGVKGLVIVGSGARLRVHPDTLADLEEKVRTGAEFDPMAGYERVAPEVAVILARRRIENGLRARLNDLKACDAFDIISRLHEISLPVLAICGAADVMTPPRYTEFLGSRIAGARTVVLEGGTHQVHLEQPEAVNAVIEEFVFGLG